MDISTPESFKSIISTKKIIATIQVIIYIIYTREWRHEGKLVGTLESLK